MISQTRMHTPLKATDGYFVWLNIIINHSSLGTHALSRISTFSGWQPRRRSLNLRSHWTSATPVTPPIRRKCVLVLRLPALGQLQPACDFALSASSSRLCTGAQSGLSRRRTGSANIWPWIMLPFRVMWDSTLPRLYKKQPQEWAVMLSYLHFIRRDWAYVEQLV